MGTNFENLIKEFLDYLKNRKKRRSATVRNYEFYLKRFINQTKVSSPEKISFDIIRRYRSGLGRLKNHRGQYLNKNTVNYHLIALRSFLKFLIEQDIETLDPRKIELNDRPPQLSSLLTNRELEELLEAPLAISARGKNLEGDNLVRLRDKALLEFLFSTGLKVSEIVNLKTDQIDLTKDQFEVQPVSGKARIAAVSNQARYWLKKYLTSRDGKFTYLFSSHDRALAARRGKKPSLGLTPRSLERIIEGYAKLVGIKRSVTPELLRRSLAQRLLDRGADLPSIQTFLGHINLATTKAYVESVKRYFKN